MRRRKEGLCIFFYLWQTAVLAWFKLSTERATSQSAWNPQEATEAATLISRGAAPWPPPYNNRPSCWGGVEWGAWRVL